MALSGLSVSTDTSTCHVHVCFVPFGLSTILESVSECPSDALFFCLLCSILYTLMNGVFLLVLTYFPYDFVYSIPLKYSESWQVVLQTRKTNAKGDIYIEDTVVYASEERPEYNDAVAKLVAANAEVNAAP